MNKQVYIVFILFIIVTGIEVILKLLKRKRADQIADLLYHRRFDEFERLLNTKGTHFFISAYNIAVLRMNEAIMKNDITAFMKSVKDLDEMHLNEQQTLFAYSRAFSYALTNAESLCRHCYERVMTCKDSRSKEYVMMIYDALILKGWKYLDRAQELAASAGEYDRANLNELITCMKENQDRAEKNG